MNKRQKLRTVALILVGISAVVCVIERAAENQQVQRNLSIPTERVQKLESRNDKEPKNDDSSTEYTVFQYYKRSELDVPADEYLRRVMEGGKKRNSNPVVETQLRRLRPAGSSQNTGDGEETQEVSSTLRKEEAVSKVNKIRKVKVQKIRKPDAETLERIRRAAAVPSVDFDSELFSMPVFLQETEEEESAETANGPNNAIDNNILFDATVDSTQNDADSPDSVELDGPTRRRVFAFYEEPDNLDNYLGKEKNDAILQEQWKATWKARGYEPQVLTLDTAKKHPLFEEYSDALNRILDSTRQVHHTPTKMRNCYFRYLAMAVAGGGTMVDLDVFPVHKFNNETTFVPSRFTLFCGMANAAQNGDKSDSSWLLQVSAQSGLPCAAVGSAEEWERVFKNLGWVSWLYRDSDHWSDMNSLTYLRRMGEIDYKEEIRVESLRTRPCQECSFRLNV